MAGKKLRILDVINEQWRYIFKDTRLMLVLFIVPIGYTLMFGYLYSAHKVTELRTVVMDQDQSQLSRQVVQAFDENVAFDVQRYVFSEYEMKEMLARGDAQFAIVIPQEFEQKVKRGESAPVLTFVDGSNMIISNAASVYANQIVTSFSIGSSAIKLQQQGLRAEEVEDLFGSIPFRFRVLYNPTYNYNEFLTFGLIGVAVQQVILLGIALTVTREKEQGTWCRYEEWRTRPLRMAFSLNAIFILLGLFNAYTTMWVAVKVFNLPFRGSVLPFLTLGLFFMIALIGIGYAASVFLKNQVGSTQITMLVAVPSFLLSGFTWPLEAMPPLLRGLGEILPLTYYVHGIRHIFVKGNGFEVIWYDCLALGLIGLVTLFAAMLITSSKRFWARQRRLYDGCNEE